MSVAVIKSVRNRRPAAPRLDYNHPLSKYCTVYWAPVDGIYDYDAGRYRGVETINNAPIRHFDPEIGLGYEFHPSLYIEQIEYGVEVAGRDAGDFTLIAFVEPKNASTSNQSFIRRGSSTDSLRLKNNGTNIVASYIDSSPAQFDATISGGGLGLNVMHRIAARKQSSTIKAYEYSNKATASNSSGGSTFRTATSGITIGSGADHAIYYLVIAFTAALTDDQIWNLLGNPFQILSPIRRVYQFQDAAGGGGVTINVPTGSVALTGLVPTVNAGNSIAIDVPLGNLALSGQVPTLLTPRTIDVPFGSLALTGQVPTVLAPNTINVPVGSLLLSGQSPTLLTPRTIDVPVGSLSLSGFAPSVGNSITIDVPVGVIALTGLVPTLINPYTIDIPVGGLVLTGFVPSVGNPTTIDVPVGSLALSGLIPAANLTDNIVVAVPVGSLALSGQVPTVVNPHTINVPVGSLALAGLVPTASASSNIVIDVPLGNIALSGQAPIVDATVNVTIDIPLGNLLLSGIAPSFQTSEVINVPVGSIVLTGLIPVAGGIVFATPVSRIILVLAEDRVISIGV